MIPRAYRLDNIPDIQNRHGCNVFTTLAQERHGDFDLWTNDQTLYRFDNQSGNETEPINLRIVAGDVIHIFVLQFLHVIEV